MKLFNFKWRTLFQDEPWFTSIYAMSQEDAIKFLDLSEAELKTLKLVMVKDVLSPKPGDFEFMGPMSDYLMENGA